MTENLFYLTSTHGNCGTNIMFHNKNGAGYGTNLDGLHLFTMDEAQKYLNNDIKSMPLLKSEVDKLSIRAVDHQRLNEPPQDDPDDKYVIQVKGFWNGNDIAFVVMGGKTFNYDEAHIFTSAQATNIVKGSDFIWSKTYLDTICRRTFQEENINTRKMITGPGIKYKKPRKPRPTTGKTRMNCPSCGKINWQYNPYDFERCSDINCSEH